MLHHVTAALHALADAAERLKSAPTVTVHVQPTDRRESILRNQNDGEIDAIARKVKARLGL